MSQYPKPPLGVIPTEIWEEQRLEDLRQAIRKRVEESTYPFEIPVKWVVEHNELLAKFEARNRGVEDK